MTFVNVKNKINKCHLLKKVRNESLFNTTFPGDDYEKNPLRLETKNQDAKQ